jgi:hypothetical protein
MTKTTPAAAKARNLMIAARLAFASGLAISLTANVWASLDHGWIGLVSGIWSPFALLFGLFLVENANRKTWAGRALLVGAGALAGIAALVSYFHLTEFFTAGGLGEPGSHLMPFTVDILMALAGPSLKRKPAPAARVARARKPVAAKSPAKLKIAN